MVSLVLEMEVLLAVAISNLIDVVSVAAQAAKAKAIRKARHGSTWSGTEGVGLPLFRKQGVFDKGVLRNSGLRPISKP